MESWLIQRAAQLRYRSHPDRSVGDVVGEQRRRFRSQERRAGCRRRVRQTDRTNLPLRRRSEWRPGARRRCSLWRRARRHRTRGSTSAHMAPRLMTSATPSSSRRVPRRRREIIATAGSLCGCAHTCHIRESGYPAVGTRRAGKRSRASRRSRAGQGRGVLNTPFPRRPGVAASRRGSVASATPKDRRR